MWYIQNLSSKSPNEKTRMLWRANESRYLWTSWIQGEDCNPKSCSQFKSLGKGCRMKRQERSHQQNCCVLLHTVMTLGRNWVRIEQMIVECVYLRGRRASLLVHPDVWDIGVPAWILPAFQLENLIQISIKVKEYLITPKHSLISKSGSQQKASAIAPSIFPYIHMRCLLLL